MRRGKGILEFRLPFFSPRGPRTPYCFFFSLRNLSPQRWLVGKWNCCWHIGLLCVEVFFFLLPESPAGFSGSTGTSDSTGPTRGHSRMISLVSISKNGPVLNGPGHASSSKTGPVLGSSVPPAQNVTLNEPINSRKQTIRLKGPYKDALVFGFFAFLTSLSSCPNHWLARLAPLAPLDRPELLRPILGLYLAAPCHLDKTEL